MDIAILILLFALHGFLVLGEIALITAKRAYLESEKAKGSSGAATALALLADSEGFLLSMRVGISLLTIIEGAFVAVKFGGNFVPLWSGLLTFEPYAGHISMALAITMAAGAAMAIGELAPKHIAVRHAEVLSVALAPFLNLIAYLIKPLSFLLNVLTKLFLRLFFIKHREEQHISE